MTENYHPKTQYSCKQTKAVGVCFEKPDRLSLTVLTSTARALTCGAKITRGQQGLNLGNVLCFLFWREVSVTALTRPSVMIHIQSSPELQGTAQHSLPRSIFPLLWFWAAIFAIVVLFLLLLLAATCYMPGGNRSTSCFLPGPGIGAFQVSWKTAQVQTIHHQLWAQADQEKKTCKANQAGVKWSAWK